jgi:hypothetical protein
MLAAGFEKILARYVMVSNGLWTYQGFRPRRTIGWNYCRERRPSAGKPSFFRDQAVIKSGQKGRV